jgi:hypothetical protein
MANRLNRGCVLAAVGALVACASHSQAQWTTGAGLIYFNGGRVGIGTDSPTGILHVVGTTGLGTIRAENDGVGAAIIGWSRFGSGVSYGTWGQSHSTLGYGALGWATNPSGTTVGVYGQSDSPSGFGGLFKGGQYGVYGWPTATSGGTVGVYGRVSSPNGWGGIFKGGFWGVWGETTETNGYGGYFLGRGYFSGRVGVGNTNPAYPLDVASDSALIAVRGNHAATTGATVGVQGETASTEGVGVTGIATATTGTPIGVFGTSPSTGGVGVSGYSNATTGTSRGVEGWSTSSQGYGVYGISSATSGSPFGVFGTAASNAGAAGVKGLSSATSGTFYGVLGEASSNDNGFAVYAMGRTGATGTKNFQIDHPLDPANKYLNHFSAEGPQPYLMYRGNVELDGNGEAVVQLPAYFEAINRDFHYQLTPIGAPAMLYVAEKVHGNQFRIAGGQPGMEVSWTVTGVRSDAFVEAYPMADETDKPAAVRGTYLSPELYGQKGGAAPAAPVRAQIKKTPMLGGTKAVAPNATVPQPPRAR